MKHFSADQVEQWMSHYYENPQPDVIPMALAGLRDGGYQSDEGAAESLSSFLGLVMRANPELIEDWLSTFRDLTTEEIQVLAHALWLSNTQEGNDFPEQVPSWIPRT